MAVLERDTLQRRLLAAGQLLGWLPEGNAVGAAAGHGPSPAADKGPVQALPLGPAGQQLQELWRLLAAWPQLTELEPTEMQGRLPALASALQLPQDRLLHACQRHPWLLGAEPDQVAGALQLLLYGVPHLLPDGRQQLPAGSGGAEAKRARLLAMLEAGAAGGGAAARPGDAEAQQGAAAAPPSLAAAGAEQVLAVLEVLGGCRQLAALGVPELQRRLRCLSLAVAAVARRTVPSAHQQLLEALRRQPRLLLLQLQRGGEAGGPRLTLQQASVPPGSGGASVGGADDAEQWQRALKAGWKATGLAPKELIALLPQLPELLGDAAL
jgi:hypothetical protein